MEQTNRMTVDFTGSTTREEFVAAAAGDLNSRVVELDVTPALSEGELLLCTIKDIGGDEDRTVDTLIITDNRLILPSVMLQSEGRFLLIFAVFDATSRLTASTMLNVAVAPDGITLVPTDSGITDQSAASVIFARLNALESRLVDAENALTSCARTLYDVTHFISTSALKTAAGSCSLISVSGQYACYLSQCKWLRIGNTVIVTFGFYTNGYSSFEIGDLPFANSTVVTAVPVMHCDYTAEGVSTQFSFDSDYASIGQGSKKIRIRRRNTDAAVVYGQVVYTTGDAWET